VSIRYATIALTLAVALCIAHASRATELGRSVLPPGWMFTTGLRHGSFRGVEVIGDSRQADNLNALQHRDRIKSARVGTETLDLEAGDFPLAHLQHLRDFIFKVTAGTPIEFTIERQVGFQLDQENRRVGKYETRRISVMPSGGHSDVYSSRSRTAFGNDYWLPWVSDPAFQGIKFGPPAPSGLGRTSPFSFTAPLRWDDRCRVEKANGWAYQVDALSPLLRKLYRNTASGFQPSSVRESVAAIYSIGWVEPLPQTPFTPPQMLPSFVAARFTEFLQRDTPEYLPLYFIFPSAKFGAVKEIRGHVDESSPTEVLYLKRSDILAFTKR